MTAHGRGPVGTEENWEAFASCCLPSNSRNFPFTADHATEDCFLSTAYEGPELFPSESDILDQRGTKVDEHSQKVTDLRRPCLDSTFQPPRGSRPIVLIHTPRELLAYRNARPPVYVHHHSGGDTPLAHHRVDLFHDRRCTSSDFLLDNAACSTRTPRSPQNTSLCACVNGEKHITDEKCLTTADASACESDCTVDTANICAGQRVLCVHCETAHTSGDEQYSTERQTHKCISGPHCQALSVYHPCKVDVQSVGQSSERRGRNSQKRYLRRRRISLVPTLGGLHEGHVHLIRQAACLSDEVWVTIFLNPLQFQSGKDFFSYPASIDEDIRTIQQVGVVNVVFVPQREALFPLDGLPTFPASTASTSASAQASLAATSVLCPQDDSVSGHTRQAGGVCAPLGTPSAQPKCYDASCQLSQAATGSQGVAAGNARLPGAASTTTRSTERDSICEKRKSCPSKRQEGSNSSESSRLFRMRVFFEDIEDVDGEGKRRPGFFGGIGTVVTQLLTLTRPTYLHLGLKDFQQVVCLKRLICGLGLDVLAVTHSTLREASDGLSLASRNKRLSGAERTAAAKYYTVLQQLCQSYERGERRVQQLESEARTRAAAEGLHIYYVTFDRWQDAAPVTYRRGSSSTGETLSCSSTAAAGKKADGATGATSSPSGAKMQEHMQQQNVSQEGGKKDLSIQMRRLEPAKETGLAEAGRRDHRPREDTGDMEEWTLESPGKYCCTMAVRGNADTTLVDNVTLTDQPQFGDLLPPPLNVPWDSSSAATKHSFFGSFLLLASLGMHLRYLNKDDLDVLQQAEEEDMKPRRDGPQLLFPLHSAGIGATEGAWQCPSKGHKRPSFPVVQSRGATAEPGAGDLAMQQQHCVAAGARTRRRGETTQVLRWLQEQRSRLFEVEGTSGKKILWMKQEGETAANAAAEDSRVSLCARSSSKACRVRAVGLFKYDLKDECRRSNKNVARVDNSGSRSAAVAACVARGQSFDTDTATRYNEKRNVTESTADSEKHRRRERFIGYVWAEEVEREGEGTRQEQGAKEECSVGGSAGILLKVKRVFVKRERRRQTLGTHLLRAFLAATYKQLVQEQQQTAAVSPLHERQHEAEAVLAHRQETPLGAKKAGQHTDGVEEGRLHQCGNSEGTACKLRRIEREQAREEATTNDVIERKQNRENGEIKAFGVEQYSKEDATEAEKGRKRRGKVEAGIACTVHLENVPHYFVDVLKEGAFSVLRAAAETTLADTQNANYCCMQVSLSEWYKTFVLNAVV